MGLANYIIYNPKEVYIQRELAGDSLARVGSALRGEDRPAASSRETWSLSPLQVLEGEGDAKLTAQSLKL